MRAHAFALNFKIQFGALERKPSQTGKSFMQTTRLALTLGNQHWRRRCLLRLWTAESSGTRPRQQSDSSQDHCKGQQTHISSWQRWRRNPLTTTPCFEIFPSWIVRSRELEIINDGQVRTNGCQGRWCGQYVAVASQHGNLVAMASPSSTFQLIRDAGTKLRPCGLAAMQYRIPTISQLSRYA